MGQITPPIPPRAVRRPDERDFAYARRQVRANLAPTPLVQAALADRSLGLKLESLQPTGSFKVRGAISALSAIDPGKHVLAVSAGNHALGIAWAAERLGASATVVIAETASPAKRAQLEGLPVTLVRHGQSYDEAEAWGLERARASDGDTVFVSAYNDPLVIAGASTVLDEIVDQRTGNGPLTVVVPVGGGGLVAGISLRASQLAGAGRAIRVIGVESANSRGFSASLAAGTVVDVEITDTIADGLSGNLEPGSVTIEVAAGRVAGTVAVSEAELHAAIRYLVTHHGIVAEGAGAAATAAVLAGKVDATEGEVVAIVSGRNIALPKLAGILAET